MDIFRPVILNFSSSVETPELQSSALQVFIERNRKLGQRRSYLLAELLGFDCTAGFLLTKMEL